jgi:hypothetical protein
VQNGFSAKPLGAWWIKFSYVKATESIAFTHIMAD